MIEKCKMLSRAILGYKNSNAIPRSLHGRLYGRKGNATILILIDLHKSEHTWNIIFNFWQVFSTRSHNILLTAPFWPQTLRSRFFQHSGPWGQWASLTAPKLFTDLKAFIDSVPRKSLKKNTREHKDNFFTDLLPKKLIPKQNLIAANDDIVWTVLYFIE